MTFLLDVNLLIALIDTRHEATGVAQSWFELEGADDWATCPITENGVVRIVSNASYSNRAPTYEVIETLRRLVDVPGHRFWNDDLTLRRSSVIDASLLTRSGDVTDTYLLALAVEHGGKLATLDRKLTPHAVRGGADALHILER